jgi:hypothetical protein
MPLHFPAFPFRFKDVMKENCDPLDRGIAIPAASLRSLRRYAQPDTPLGRSRRAGDHLASRVDGIISTLRPPELNGIHTTRITTLKRSEFEAVGDRQLRCSANARHRGTRRSARRRKPSISSKDHGTTTAKPLSLVYLRQSPSQISIRLPRPRIRCRRGSIRCRSPSVSGH